MNERNKIIRPQPWYKERLRTKHLKSLKPGDQLNCLNPRNWVLLRKNMDDFRDGNPPDFEGVYYLPGATGMSPVLQHENKDNFHNRMKDNNLKVTKQRPFLTKEQKIYDKKTPLMKIRQDYIEEVEYGLTQHPLALYPHLEDGMPPELFDKLVDILDPEMNPDDCEEADLSAEETSLDFEKNRSESSLENGSNSDLKESSKDLPDDTNEPVNSFVWMKADHEDHQLVGDEIVNKTVSSPSQDEHVKEVTSSFCNWVRSLEGETNNIEESTVMSLFASGYETKPALSVPIHVVELSHIPAELRETVGISSHDITKKIHQQSKKESSMTVGMKNMKMKYGAWYLKPTSWKIRSVNEDLENSVELEKREQSESKIRSEVVDKELSTIHGSRAFRDFLERKQRRIPDFMTKVALLQDKNDETEKDCGEREHARLRANHRSKSVLTSFSNNP